MFLCHVQKRYFTIFVLFQKQEHQFRWVNLSHPLSAFLLILQPYCFTAVIDPYCNGYARAGLTMKTHSANVPRHIPVALQDF
ncbi:hypothetical protein FKM82_009018 [Ascaphus truei]